MKWIKCDETLKKSFCLLLFFLQSKFGSWCEWKSMMTDKILATGNNRVTNTFKFYALDWIYICENVWEKKNYSLICIFTRFPFEEKSSLKKISRLFSIEITNTKLVHCQHKKANIINTYLVIENPLSFLL